MSAPRVMTATGQKVIAIYGSQLFDDVLAIEAEALLRSHIEHDLKLIAKERARTLDRLYDLRYKWSRHPGEGADGDTDLAHLLNDAIAIVNGDPE